MEIDATKSGIGIDHFYYYHNSCLWVAFNFITLLIFICNLFLGLQISSSFLVSLSNFDRYSYSRSHLSPYNNIPYVLFLLLLLLLLHGYHMHLKFLSFCVFFPAKIRGDEFYCFVVQALVFSLGNLDNLGFGAAD